VGTGSEGARVVPGISEGGEVGLVEGFVVGWLVGR
jgi:hypothetical protein